MPRIAPLSLLAGLLLAAVPVAAQQLRQPDPPVVRATPQDRPEPARVHAPRATQPPVVPSDPRQRPQSPPAIPSTGPATKLPTQAPLQERQSEPRQQPLRDASGRPVGGMVRVSPNRAYDPATGRYYWTTPSGWLIGDRRRR